MINRRYRSWKAQTQVSRSRPFDSLRPLRAGFDG